MSHWVEVILEDAFYGKDQLPNYVIDGLKRLRHFVQSSDCYQFRTGEFEELADAISICDNLTELSRLLWQVATSAGFQHFSLFLINQGRSPNHASRMCTSHSDEWLSQYEGCLYQYIDPVFAAARERDGCFEFSSVSNRCPAVIKFWEDAEKHGIGRNGLCYAATRPDGSRFAVTFSSSARQETVEKLIRLNRHDLVVLAELAIECFCFVSHGVVPKDSVLSNDELRFLHTMATSDRPENALTQMAVFGGNNAIQASIRKKLNVETVFQAIAVASAMQWFDGLPICADEVVTPFPKLAGWDVVNFFETVQSDE